MSVVVTYMSPTRTGIRTFARILQFAAASLTVLMILACVASASADLQIKIPKRTKPTPVQQLNQQGVRALNKNDLTHARRYFYKAYLLDPDDPFTLNNLGYLAELDGDIDKAQKFYDLAAENSSDAVVAISSNPELRGKEVSQVAGNAVSSPMQVNRLNVAAMGLMMKDRAPEADLLRKALGLNPSNPFTLNNLGYALEKEGELEQATRYYSQAASSGSQEKVVVALNRSWRGRSISEIASRNAEAARRELSAEGTSEARVARLNLRGVSALNRNEVAQARKYFQEAYRIDPRNAFCLNNMGYISEVEGDRETADFYYGKARDASHNQSRVTLATRKSAQGLRLSIVADENDGAVQNAQEKQLAVLRASGAPPIPLRTRDNAYVREPAAPPQPEPETPVRIIAEDNPPELPPAIAAPQPKPKTAQPVPAGFASATPQPSPTQSAQTRMSSSAPAEQGRPALQQPQAVETVPILPVVPPSPEEERPLLPVIPDEQPSR